MRRLLIAAGLGAALLSGGRAAAVDEPSEDAASIVASLDDASPYAPITRLGRWDGSGYVDVESRSIDSSKVVVVSHGWEPGFQAQYDALQAQQTTLVPVWDPRLADTTSGSPIATIGPLVEALGQAEPDATIMLFSWIDQSATPFDPFDARTGENATEINGHRLAVALDQALADDWDGELHLIGHSFGSNIVTTAALALDAPLRQLTLMDSPEDELVLLGGAANDLRYKLPRLDIGRAPDSVFVDNFISEVGIRYGDLPGLDQVVDTRLQPPDGGLAVRHQYPVVWYGQALDTGAVDPLTGPWWSPLLGGDPATVGSYYEAASRESLALDELAGPPPADVGEDVLWPTVPLALASGGSAITVGGSDDVVEAELETSVDSLLLEFDVAFDGAADGATLDVAVDGRLRYTAAPAAGTGDAGAMVLLWDVGPGEHTLTVALTGGGEDATATLSDLRLVEVAGIVRNLTEQQTTDLVGFVIAGVAIVALAVVIGVVLLVRALLRRRRRHRRRTSAIDALAPDRSAHTP